MSIINKSFTCNFTQIPNQIINDKKVSFKAKGLYLYFVSKPDEWEFSLSGITSQAKESMPTVISIINELIENGYMEKIKRRNSNGKQEVNQYLLHESPTDSRNLTQKTRFSKFDAENMSTSNTKHSNTKLKNKELVQENKTTERKEKEKESSSTSADFKIWAKEKSKDKLNPSSYAYALEKKYKENDENIIIEFSNWLNNYKKRAQEEKIAEHINYLKKKKLTTKEGKKTIIGIEWEENNYKIYFEEGGFAVVQTLENIKVVA